MAKKTKQIKKDKNQIENTEKRKWGKPSLDCHELIKLCEINCTVDECCSFFEVCEETLNNFCLENFKAEDGSGMNFSEVYNTHKRRGNISLRRMQWHSAESGSVDMQKWLGKNNLLQSDNAAELAKSAEQEDRIKAIVEALWGVK